MLLLLLLSKEEDDQKIKANGITISSCADKVIGHQFTALLCVCSSGRQRLLLLLRLTGRDGSCPLLVVFIMMASFILELPPLQRLLLLESSFMPSPSLLLQSAATSYTSIQPRVCLSGVVTVPARERELVAVTKTHPNSMDNVTRVRGDGDGRGVAVCVPVCREIVVRVYTSSMNSNNAYTTNGRGREYPNPPLIF
jgi:hypothetical protein